MDIVPETVTHGLDDIIDHVGSVDEGCLYTACAECTIYPNQSLALHHVSNSLERALVFSGNYIILSFTSPVLNALVM